jgi:PAS domain S-box-containing protein
MTVPERRHAGTGTPSVRAQLADFVGGAPASMALFDAELRLVEASPSFRSGFVTTENPVGRQLPEVLEGLPGRVVDHLRDAVQGRPTCIEFDSLQLAGRDRSYVRYEAKPWWDEKGLAGAVLLLEDVTERVLSDRQTQRSHALLEETESVSGVGGWEYTVDGGRLFWTRQTFLIHDLPSDSPQPDVETAIDHYRPEDRPRIRAAVEAAITDARAFSIVAHVVTARGREIVVRSRGRPMFRDGRVVSLVGSIQDISEERASAIEAERHRAMLEAIAQTSRDAIFVKDVAGRFQFSNPMHARLVGLPPQSIIGRTDDAFFGEEIAGAMSRADERVMWRREAETIEETIDTEIGRRSFLTTKSPWILSDGALVGLIGVARDVTEYRSALDQLQRNEDRMIVALEAARCGLWDWHVPTGEVYYDANWMALLGFEHTELPHTFATWEELCHPDDHAKGLERVRAWLEGRIDEYVLEHRLRTKTGAWKWILGTGRITERDENGEPLRVVGVNVDIDDRKRWEVEIAKARDAAEAASRAKTEFLANMSHEIRTPMTAILGYTELLGEPEVSGSPERLREAVQTIHRNGEHLLAIINDVLDISKIEAGQLSIERVAAAPLEIAQGIVELFRVRAESKGLELRLLAELPLPELVASDPMRLRQILSNLVGNAVKFTENGSITLQVGTTERDGMPMLRFDIRDTGIGMSGAQINGLFRPFAQGDASTTRRFGGTGLGLSISKRLAEMLGGTIEVESEEGRGTTFTVFVAAPPVEAPAGPPQSSVPAVSVQEPPTTQSAVDLTGVRILLAEDGPDNQRLVSFLLRKVGAEVEIADNGRIAVERVLANSQERIDLILMDMQMPEMDGYEATSRIRAAGIEIPIIALTAHAMTGDREKCLAAGCSDFGTKPIHRAQLLEQVRRWARPGATPAS